MIWLVILLVVVAAFAMPAFGKALGRVVGLLLVLAAIGVLGLLAYDRQQKAERERAKTLIKPHEVELAGVELRNGYGAGSYTLVGRVRNRSARYTLNELRLKLTMRDCTDTKTCEVVAESDEAIYVTVPPNQARDLDEYVSFAGLRSPRGKHQWSYEVQEIVGR